MDVKGEDLLQLFNKSKWRNGTKRFYSQNFSLFLVKFKKLGFSAPLISFKVKDHRIKTFVTKYCFVYDICLCVLIVKDILEKIMNITLFNRRSGYFCAGSCYGRV